MSKIGIIGAGISGLTLAWKLKLAGYDVTVFEASSNPGGAIQSHRDGNWLAEAGPNSIQDSDTSVTELVESLGLTNRLLEASTEAKRRYIVRYKRPQLVPNSPISAIKTPLFSWKAKFGILGEPFRPVLSDSSIIDESLASFVRRRLGPEFLDYAINPMVGGIYAGNPERLSVGHAFGKVKALEGEFGSLIKGSIGRMRQRKKSGQKPHKKRVLSFPNGLGELTNTLAEKLGSDLHLGTRVTSITRHPNSTYSLSLAKQNSADSSPVHPILTSPTPHSPLPTSYSQIIYCGTTYGLESIHLEGFEGMPNSRLTQLPYAPVSSLTLGFPRDAITHPLDGFGVLVPEKESMNILGCLFTSSIFPDRAPVGHVTLTIFIGGMRSPELVDRSKDDIQKLVLKDLDTLLGVKSSPVFSHFTRWNKAIPQYETGFGEFLSIMDTIEEKNPGFYLVGNYRTGISLDACIRHSWNHPLTQTNDSP
jgi:oxygen-dependent protoporphyrinogen oxidase